MTDRVHSFVKHSEKSKWPFFQNRHFFQVVITWCNYNTSTKKEKRVHQLDNVCMGKRNISVEVSSLKNNLIEDS